MALRKADFDCRTVLAEYAERERIAEQRTLLVGDKARQEKLTDVFCDVYRCRRALGCGFKMAISRDDANPAMRKLRVSLWPSQRPVTAAQGRSLVQVPLAAQHRFNPECASASWS